MNTVKDLLSAKGSQVYTIAPDTAVIDALKVMAEKEVGALVVLSGGRVVGMLSERDYARKIVLKGKIAQDTPVREIMSKTVTTVLPGQSVEECMKIMTETRCRHLPVLDDGTLTGLISIGDIVKSIIMDQKFLIENLESYITGAPEVR